MPPLLLLLFKFFLVTVSVLSLSIPGLIELHVSCLAVELHIFGLLFPNHDWVFEVDMYDDYQFMLRGLKEQMLYIAEQDINYIAPVVMIS